MSQDRQDARHPNDKRPKSIYSFIVHNASENLSMYSHAHEFVTVQEAFAAKRSNEEVFVRVANVGFYKVQRP